MCAFILTVCIYIMHSISFFSIHHYYLMLLHFDCTHEILFCCRHVVVLVFASEYVVKEYCALVDLHFITCQNVRLFESRMNVEQCL